MEGVAVDNLIDFDLPSESSSLTVVEGQNQGHMDIFSPEPASSRGLRQDTLLEPLAPTKASSHHHHHHDNDDSDATESADSENDMDPPSHVWDERRSSSSSSHSVEDADPDALERRTFMKAYVDKIFHGNEEFDQEEKARFGELCSGENGKGREWFAKYVSAQRCHSKCVSEPTFYRLVQSFAVVLFECYQMDDYTPAKNLMTMCFTFYYIGKAQPPPSELLERGTPPVGLDSYLNKANSWLTGKKDAAERLLKTTSKSDVKGFFGGLESKLRNATEEKKGDKVYLYTHLKQQPIWHTLRFWNAAFFDAVHCERKKRSPTTRLQNEKDKKERKTKWCHMSQQEKDDNSKIDENIAFGQLGTFTHNMLAFGLSKKLCNDFLKKQAVIGNLNEEQYKLLTEHIEKMAVE
uniref:SBF1/SBF2 domain-containing protein n=1 Tax=Periophthalmus magnuspinnatus TaxID=409849 RepID=A0A3B3ZCD2_9GOBI